MKYKIKYAEEIDAENNEEAIKKLISILSDKEFVSDTNLFVAEEIDDQFKPFLEISVDDIYYHAKTIGKKITREDAQEIFDNFDRSDVDCENSTFWGHIQYLIESFKSE